MSEHEPPHHNLPYTSPELGEVVDDRYELRRVLGTGAEGIVYEALHRYTGTRVALKLVSPEMPTRLVAKQRVRLLREARTLARLRHPGIVGIYDAGLYRGAPYVAMELLEGRTLEGLLATRGRLPAADAVSIVAQAADALAISHRFGVVHRDIKPSNLVIVRGLDGLEHVKIVDFGTSKHPGMPNESRVTAVGAIIGTPAYMAPEQLMAQDDVDGRSDVYALGVVLYEAVTGQLLREGTYPQIVHRFCATDAKAPTVPTDRGVPRALARVIERALAPRREDRQQTSDELARDLRESISDGRSAPPSSVLADPTRASSRGEGPKRAVPRAPYMTPVRMVLASGAVLDGRSEDVSEGGMLVLANASFTSGEMMTVRFALPIEGHVVACTAEVRWVGVVRGNASAEGARAVGLAFIGAPEAIQVSLGRYVALMNDPARQRHDDTLPPASSDARG